MIDKNQLNKIAISTGLNLYQQEKDYLLKLFLYFYYKKYDKAIFKGGTCLKYISGLPRFSEDLDFNIKNPNHFKEEVKHVLKEISGLGINNYFIKDEIFLKSYVCEIGFEGPLFNGDKQSRNKFRIDAGHRKGTFLRPEWKTIKSEYPETGENFIIYSMNLEEILAEKITALFQRKKGRDIFDVWFMINSGVKINEDMLKNKFLNEKIYFNLNNLINKDEYIRDISRLTAKLIPYQQIKKDIINKLGFLTKK